MSKRNNKRSTGKIVVLNEEELIRQVSLRPILFDRSLKAYRKSGLRHHQWKDVGNEMGATVEECRQRWRSLRDSFSKHYKLNKKATPESTVKRKKWVFYDQMSFIAPYLDNNCYEIQDYLLDEFGDNSNSDEADTVITASPNDDDDNEKNSRVVKLERSAHLQNDQSPSTELRLISPTPVAASNGAEENVHQQHQQQQKGLEPVEVIDAGVNNGGSCGAIAAELSSDEKFLLSCAPAMQRLSYRKNSLARLKIQQALFEIEFGSIES